MRKLTYLVSYITGYYRIGLPLHHIVPIVVTWYCAWIAIVGKRSVSGESDNESKVC